MDAKRTLLMSDCETKTISFLRRMWLPAKKMMKKNYANDGNKKNEMNSIETDTITKDKKKKAKKKKDKKGKKKKAQLAAIDTNTILTDVMLAESDTVLTLFGQSNAVVEYDLTNMEKIFPHVTTLKIEDGIVKIRMKNRTFPNICKVISESEHFENGSTMLISVNTDAGYEEEYYGRTLLNTFCKPSDYILDFKDVNRISGMALDGCMAHQIINTERLESLDKDALADSYFESLEDTLIMFGDCLVKVNGKDISFELTDSIKRIVMIDGFDSADYIKELIVKDFRLLHVLRNFSDKPFCETIHLYADAKTRDEVELEKAIEKNKLELSCKHVLLSPSNNEELTRVGCEDDILYQTNRGMLITGSAPWFLQGNVTFPGKTWLIGTKLISNNIESICIPKSVEAFTTDASISGHKVSSITCETPTFPNGFSETIREFITIVPCEVEITEDDWISIDHCGKKNMIPRYMTESQCVEYICKLS